MEESKTGLYIVAIVGIVALIAIIVMMTANKGKSQSLDGENSIEVTDETGQVFRIFRCGLRGHYNSGPENCIVKQPRYPTSSEGSEQLPVPDETYTRQVEGIDLP